MNELKTEDVMRELEAWIYDFQGTSTQFCALCDAITLLSAYQSENAEKDAEIERLRAMHKGFREKFRADLDFPFCSLSGCEGASKDCHKTCPDSVINKARAEAITEFADFVCEGRVSNDPVVIAVRCAEKEMKESD